MNVRARTQETCTCKSYAFPHRVKSGACLAKQRGPYCGECGQPGEAKQEDFGYGLTEAWGHVTNHSDVQTVSRCCEAPMFLDASLNEPYEFEAEYD